MSAWSSVHRDVVFIATDSAGNVLKKTWTRSLLFTNSGAYPNQYATAGGYNLTDVPSNIANLSAKTAWSLRSKHVLPINPATGNAFTDSGYGSLDGQLLHAARRRPE